MVSQQNNKFLSHVSFINLNICKSVIQNRNIKKQKSLTLIDIGRERESAMVLIGLKLLFKNPQIYILQICVKAKIHHRPFCCVVLKQEFGYFQLLFRVLMLIYDKGPICSPNLVGLMQLFHAMLCAISMNMISHLQKNDS